MGLGGGVQKFCHLLTLLLFSKNIENKIHSLPLLNVRGSRCEDQTIYTDIKEECLGSH